MGICPRISVSRRASRGARIRKSPRTPPSVALAPRKSRIRASGAPTIPSPIARIAGRASRLLLESPTIARTRRWRLSRCARRAKRNTQTLAIVVSTPKRSPAAPAVQRSHCGAWTGMRGGTGKAVERGMPCRGASAHHVGCNPRSQRSWRLSSRLRRHEFRCGFTPSAIEAPRREALRSDGARPRRHKRLLRRRRRGGAPAHQLRGADRLAERERREAIAASGRAEP